MKEQWIYEQFSAIDVGDARLQKRAVDVARGCAEHPEESLQDALINGQISRELTAFLIILKLHIRRFNNPITIKS
jgi:hypothetical protein